MATNLALYDYGDEDYIDIEISSSPKSKDFEFQMSFIGIEKETTADELFYKGKLLPLHLRPRRQMVQNLLRAAAAGEGFEEDPYYHSVPCTNTTNTPLDSCNISPSNSCRVSFDFELNTDDYFFEWSTELTSSINDHSTKKPWSKKLKLVEKLKASRTYLKSLFSKYVCNPEADENKKKHGSGSSCPKMGSVMKNIDEDNVQRRSISGVIKSHPQTKCCLSSSSSNSSSGASSSSSSFSFNSSGPNELQFLRGSKSETEIEVSIDAAIAHCKDSQQIFCSRNLTRGLERRKKEEEEEEIV